MNREERERLEEQARQSARKQTIDLLEQEGVVPGKPLGGKFRDGVYYAAMDIIERKHPDMTGREFHQRRQAIIDFVKGRA